MPDRILSSTAYFLFAVLIETPFDSIRRADQRIPMHPVGQFGPALILVFTFMVWFSLGAALVTNCRIPWKDTPCSRSSHAKTSHRAGTGRAAGGSGEDVQTKTKLTILQNTAN